ncbi:MAG: aspartate aminotransferase family protein [Ruminococcus sp.]|jgi:acetylornithine/N-succinyldiaminopimelate aminotransferase|nr:aspartate aminotransferase family protein [Ruminococcus sp.]
MNETINEFNKYVMQTYGRYDIVLETGENDNAASENDKTYIDFGSGIGTNSLGYCNSAWVDAVTAQVKKLQHTSNYYYTAVQGEFAKKLCKISGYKKVFFGNSGAEANECAIKIARKYSFDKYGIVDHNADDCGKYRAEIITLTQSFHGRTITTLSATGQEDFHNYFFPFTPGFVHCEPNIRAFENALSKKTCAVMLEFIQGEGGVNNLSEDFVKAVFDICRERDILIIADEVQTGVGRTGKFLAAAHYGVKPDIVSLAKGIAGGLPIGACLVGERCENVLGKGDHGSTFGGNPVCAAGGNAVLDTLNAPGFLDEVTKKGDYFREKLLKMPAVESVSGIGLMIGIKFKGDIKAADISKKCHENGLLVLTAKDKLRFLPPLNIGFDEIDMGLGILAEILQN